MKIRLGFLGLGLIALLGSLLASSSRISASAATDRLSVSPATGPSVLGTGKTPLGGASVAPRTMVTSTVYLPMLMNNYVQGIYGYLRQGGVPIGGIWLELWFYNGSGWSIAAATTTNSAGFYVFNGIPSLSMGQSYYVEYSNPEYNSSRLSYWASGDVTSYTVGSSVYVGTSDLANILLAAPSPGAIVTLPYFFQWTRRTATPSDSYFLQLFNISPFVPAYTPLLGYVSGVTLTSLPPGFSPNVQYGWAVGFSEPGPNGGFGYSYYFRRVTFTNYGLSISGPLNVAPQTTGRRKDLPLPTRSEK